MRRDVAVLGAGIVGASVALHLQARGRSVALIDRRGAGEETSFGNAGMIQREGVYPYGFPQDPRTLARYVLNGSIDASYHLSALPALAPFLWRYWRHSRPARHAGIARQYAKLIERCVAEHRALAEAASAAALLSPGGWQRVFRTAQARDRGFAEAERWRAEFGIEFRALDAAMLRAGEPHLAPVLTGALHWTEPWRVSDPHELVRAYVGLLERRGGSFVQGDAASLQADGEAWRVQTAKGPVQTAAVVVALGPWADAVTRALGYRLPLAVKRGYHMHYRVAGEACLNTPTQDSERGYFMAQTARGIRLTTGVEFARRDAPRTPVQLERAEPIARALFPLGERLDAEPWMGSRPCTPDMLPIIGPAPRHRNLWFAFGHAHHGLTLGPVTGRLVAEMMAGETPCVDPAPYRADRF